MSANNAIAILGVGALFLTTTDMLAASVDPDQPKPIVRVEPAYPREAYANCIEGIVQVSYSVGTDGAVTDIEVLDSSPPDVFDEAARNVLPKWLYARQAKKETGLITTLTFRIRDSEHCPSKPRKKRDRDCVALGEAHANLVNGCFSARRHFAATLNKKPVKRELVQLEYTAGKLDIEQIEEETFEKRIQMDGDGDMAVETTFACDRITRNSQGHYELESAEDPERVIFDYDSGNRVLLPLRWEFEDKARFLLKKFHFKAHADYSNVIFKPCESAVETGKGH